MVSEYIGDGVNLYLDISSSSTGFAFASMDAHSKTAIIHKAGVMTFPKDWSDGVKYKYLVDFILNVAYIQYKIQAVIAEGYAVNFKRAMGTLKIPEMHGAVKCSCQETAIPLSFHICYPQSWRSSLGIKKDSTKKGSAAWKIPTKKKIEELLKYTFPDNATNLIDGKSRKLTYDLVDAIGIALGWLTKEPNSCTNYIIKDKAIE